MNRIELKNTDDYHNQQAADTLSYFEVSPEQGLSKNEAQARLETFGPNEIIEKEEPLWHRIFRRFWGPIPWMIEIAALLSAIVQKWEDFIVILIMLLINVVLDFFQEHRALNALKVLKQQVSLEVRALRDGQYCALPAKELVPGDIIRIRIGDVVPADVQLLRGDFLSIDESSLTGESLPVTKRQGEVAYSNTVVKQGEMVAVVVNTGQHTRFNAVVSLVAKASLEERSHFQKWSSNRQLLDFDDLSAGRDYFGRRPVPSRRHAGNCPLRAGVDRGRRTGGLARRFVGHHGRRRGESGA